ncbi:MAG: hypothetical protein A3K19_10745 [Lentisphaerae bacterium RIFOXYB12_FULL_65_16]|nr:MAG: hypothetical protein A3K19_10745 [Lentisphaerae bacterium RIFOXYB12_FULL_65_16]
MTRGKEYFLTIFYHLAGALSCLCICACFFLVIGAETVFGLEAITDPKWVALALKVTSLACWCYIWMLPQYYRPKSPLFVLYLVRTISLLALIVCLLIRTPL